MSSSISGPTFSEVSPSDNVRGCELVYAGVCESSASGVSVRGGANERQAKREVGDSENRPWAKKGASNGQTHTQWCK